MIPHLYTKYDEPSPPTRGYFQKNWVGVCGTLLATLTQFQIKTCDFPYPFSDLIKNFIHYLKPEALEPGA